MEIREVMTESVVTASADAPVREIAEIMRERNVGSVVLLDHDGEAIAADHASSPIVTGEPGMDVEDATQLMVSNGIRRLPILAEGKLTGIVTLDDLAARIGDATLAASITAQVTRAALPNFYFHDRGG